MKGVDRCRIQNTTKRRKDDKERKNILHLAPALSAACENSTSIKEGDK